MDNKQRFAILNEYKKTIEKICPDISPFSGIYLFYRKNKNNENCVYIGQAKNLLNRVAQHFVGRKQHIDKSLYLHKLWSEENPYGWKIKIIRECRISELDLYEKQYIDYYMNKSCKVYNVAGGGQIDKAQDVGKRYEVKLKSYKNGKNVAYNKAKEYVKTMFNKYLDYSIKGKPTKIKERKLKEFEEFLGG